MSEEKIKELINSIHRYDSGTIANIVAGYPNNPLCLKLFSHDENNWYTNHSARCMFPELGVRTGYAVTCVAGPATDVKKYTLFDLLKAVEESPKPTIVVIKQEFPEDKKASNAQVGGIMMNAFKALGSVGVISDGPARDLNEVRELDMQYMLTGTTPCNTGFDFYAINTPVNVFNMDVVPGDMIHMDENGAIKFPAERLYDIVDAAQKLEAGEAVLCGKLKEAKSLSDIYVAFDVK